MDWRFQAGGRATNGVVQPGESIRFPYVRSRVQRLTVFSHGGAPAARTRARVTVDFDPGTWPLGGNAYCISSLPPRIEVLVLPRRS